MRIIALLAFSLVALTGAAVQTAAAAERPAQTVCPVTGKKLSSVQSPVEVQVNGFRFLVIDAESRTKALGEPEKAFSALARNKEAADPVSQVCPIMGNRVNPALFVEKDGYRIYMCCRGCTKPIQNNFGKVLQKLSDQAVQGDPEEVPSM